MEAEQERIIRALEERLEIHDNSRKAAQDKLREICDGLREQVNELEESINRELEEKYNSEDNRLQAALNELRGNSTISAFQKAKAELLVTQSYEIAENKEPKLSLAALYKLKAGKHFVPELVEMRKPTNVRVADVNRGNVSVRFTCLTPDEEKVFSKHNIEDTVKCKCMIFKKCNEQEGEEYLFDKKLDDLSFTFTPDTLEAKTAYGIRVKMVVGDREYEWSDIVEFATPEFKECCAWKKCPDYVDENRKYVVDGKNPRIATKINGSFYCTIIGNISIPLDTVAIWSIKILESKNNDGHGIYTGVAPFDINQNGYDNYKCGWYFSCCSLTLSSGPPHNYRRKEYGPRKKPGRYMHTGVSVDVVMDTAKGELSFALDGADLGVAYEGIPLDKPLASCVILYYDKDSVELGNYYCRETKK